MRVSLPAMLLGTICPVIVSGASASTITDIDDNYYKPSLGTILLDNEVTLVEQSINFARGTLSVSLSSPHINDKLSLASDNDPTAEGAISIIDSNIYVGKDGRQVRIGAIDSLQNGQNGQNLLIHFAIPFTNGSFEEPLDIGWTLYEQQYGDDGDEIDYDNFTVPLANDRDYSGGSGTSYPQNSSGSMTLRLNQISNTASVGTHSLSIYSSGGILDEGVPAGSGYSSAVDGHGSFHGPYVHSDIVEIEQDEGIALDFRAVGTSDDYEVFGTLRRVDSNGDFMSNSQPTADASADNILLFAQRGHDTSGFITTSESLLNAGRYRFEFVGGTYDYTGGLGVGSTLYIDNVNLTSAALIQSDLVESIAEHIQYSHSGDLAPQGERTLTYTATTLGGVSHTGQSILAMNTHPVLSGISSSPSTNEDTPFTFTPTLVDPDNDESHTYTIQNLPTWLSFNDTDGTISGIPTNDNVGSYPNIIIRVEDKEAAYDTLTFTLSVNNTNDDPLINGEPSGTVDQDTPYIFTAAASDIDLGDTVRFEIDNMPYWANFNTVTGTLSGTPKNDDVGVYENITISARDNASAVASLPPFNLTVININDAPVISGSPETYINQDSTYEFVPNANDVDANDNLTFSITNKPIWADFDNITGKLSGNPSNSHVDYYDNITIAVEDLAGAIATLPPFFISVANTNDTPRISDINDQIINEGETLSLRARGLDIDEGATLTYSISGMPAWAEFDNDLGLLIGTPSNEDVGFFRDIIITVTDEYGSSSTTAPFTIEVANINDSPLAENDRVTHSGNTPVFIDVLRNDTDIDSDTIRIEAASATTGLVSIDDISHGLLYQPETDFNGVAEINYTITDGELSASAIVHVLVTNAITYDKSMNYEVPFGSLNGVTLTRGNISRDLEEGEIDKLLQLVDGQNNQYVFTPDNGNLGTGRYQFDFLDSETGLPQTFYVDVLPFIAFSAESQYSGDIRTTASVVLSDTPPSYPVTVSLFASNIDLSQSDEAFLNEQIIIEEGLNITLPLQAITFDSMELALSDSTLTNATLGSPITHSIIITNELPALPLQVEIKQNEEHTLVIDPSQPFTLSVIHEQIDSLDITWLSDAASLPSAHTPSITFDSGSFTEGRYTLIVEALHRETGQSGRREVNFAVTSTCNSSCTSDNTTGIPHDENPYPDEPEKLILCPMLDEGETSRVDYCQSEMENLAMEVPNNYQISVGIEALTESIGTGQYAAAVTDKSQLDTDFNHVSIVVDFEISGLTNVGESVPVTIPLPINQPITSGAILRKYMNGTWQDFAIDSDNYIESAGLTDAGKCPSVLSSVWTSGLTEGDLCLRIFIKDGGPNDDDGIENGVIVDPSVLATPKAENGDTDGTVTPTTKSGGSLPYGYLFTIAVLALLRLRKPRKH